MVKVELTGEEIIFLLECLKWNKYHYKEKWDTKSYGRDPNLYPIKEKNIDKMNDLINKFQKIQNGKN